MGESNEKAAHGVEETVAVAAPVKPEEQTKTETRGKVKKLPPFHVVLVNDDDHTYDYVILMLGELFGLPPEMGYEIAKAVDKSGKAIVMTTHRELAELKRDQIMRFGADTRVSSCRSSMLAVIEAAEK